MTTQCSTGHRFEYFEAMGKGLVCIYCGGTLSVFKSGQTYFLPTKITTQSEMNELLNERS
jgi:hypothetical protein